MKLVYFADGPWAQKALMKMVKAGYTVSRMYVRYHQPDRLLMGMAEDLGIEVVLSENVNELEEIQSIRSLGAELGVSMSFNQIIRRELIDVFLKGMINCHAGKLPYYRGRNVLNWALINGEKEIGVTCHYIDEKIDSGDIILQKTFPVEQDDDYKSVLEKAYEHCSDILLESLNLIKDDNVHAISQPSAGTYYVGRMDGDEYIDWNWTSEQIYNFVRAISDPGPCARTWIWGDNRYCQVLIRKVEVKKNQISYRCINGAVVGKTEEGYPVVKTGDTTITVLEYEIEKSCKTKLKIGDRLGVNLNLVMQKLWGTNYHERLLA